MKKLRMFLWILLVTTVLFPQAMPGISPQTPAQAAAAGTGLLLGAGRFEVTAFWKNPADGSYGPGTGTPIADDSGYFSFLSEGAVDLGIKILDGQAINGCYWVLYSGLTDLPYAIQVVDRETGLQKTFERPALQAAGYFDPQAFPVPGLASYGSPRGDEYGRFASLQGHRNIPTMPPAMQVEAATPCKADDTTLCLNQSRFAVKINWRNYTDGTTGAGHAVSIGSESGYFWFFGSSQAELIVKVLDGNKTNGYFWFLYGALTDLEYTITVTDTQTGTVKTYFNPPRTLASVADVKAFPWSATTAGNNPGPNSGAMTLAQTISDQAQLTTLAFSGLAMITGNLEAQSFFPPGKVADYTGFQYLRDNDPDGMGHNTSFLTRIANNVIYLLNDAQFEKLKTLAVSQMQQIDLYGYKRFPLMKAFRRLLDGDIPAGSAGLNLNAVKKASRELYLLDGQISYDRALLYAAILQSLDSTQKAYLANMKGKGWNSWPSVTDAQIRSRMQSLPQNSAVAVMTYASDLFSWYAGSVDADVYFCPERQGTYYGGFYIKDAPAIGHEGYGINEQLTATAGSALSDSAQGYVTATQAGYMAGLLEKQKANLYGSPTASIVKARTEIAALLRQLLSGSASADSVKTQVLSWSALYGELDGENNYYYANTFAQVYKSLSAEQKTKLAALRKSIMSGTYSDGTPFDFSVCTTPFLYSAPITDKTALAPYLTNTDSLFFEPTETVTTAISASFTYSPAAPIAGQPVQFTDTTTGSPTNWSWSFSDGGTSSSQNPSHLFPTAGIYAVKLTAGNTQGSASASRNVTVLAASNSSTFSLTSSAVAEGGALPIRFTCEGTGNTLPLAWSNPPAGTKSYAIIMHTIAPDTTKWYWMVWNIPSTVTSLTENSTGIGTLGSNSVNDKGGYSPPCSSGPGTKTYTYTVYALSSAPQISATPITVTRDQLLQAISDRTLGSAALNTTYARTTDTNTAAGFRFAPAEPKTGQAIQFTDASTGNPTSWTWSFGDGSAATVQNPTHTYAAAGTYTVTLKTNATAGVNTFTRSIAVSATTAGNNPGPNSGAMTLAQTISDQAQLTTLAFSGLAMITGNLEAQSFFPPGKVADYTGFQYLRDNDPDGMGHNTSFLTRIANNVIYLLNDAQFEKLKTLAVSQMQQIDLYGYKRFPLMKAFRRLLDGDIPAGSAGLNLNAVKKASRELYLLDGQISYDRALLYAAILQSLDSTQKAYLANMKGKGWNSWPSVTDAQIRSRMQSLPQNSAVAVMTYASDLFSWYAGSVDADVYFCPERQGTYYGGFYIKDAPAIGHEGYGINEQLTATAGSALSDSAQGYVTATQAGYMAGLLEKQKANLYGSPTASIVKARTEIAALLRQLLSGSASADSVKTQVLSWSALYGELDGENNYYYANTFAQVYKSLSAEQKTKLAALRKSIMSGTYSDGTPFDFSVCTTPFLYSAPITDKTALAPYLTNTDSLFFEP